MKDKLNYTMTKTQIIDETVAYYSEDTSRRANTNSACFYYQEATGNMCAVGRCANAPKELGEGKYIGTILREISDEQVFKPEYQGHELEFWENLQMVHDRNWNWDNKGLTECGQKNVQNLKERFV